MDSYATQERDPQSLSKTLLSESEISHPSYKQKITILFISLLLTACIGLSAASAFAFLYFSSASTSSSTNSLSTQASPPAPLENISRPLTKLENHPVVILISSDGFRFGYQFKTHTPNIHRLINEGTEAEAGLIPVFPTLTFPNHYSIATGLYPAWHGIVSNYFFDPETSEFFNKSKLDPKWWLGEPLWVTLANHGLKAATYFWPGSEVHKGKWDCPINYCSAYKESKSKSFEDRVDAILDYFHLPISEIPSFMALYLSDPDSQGHKVGPDDPQITKAVARIDSVIGRLIDGLKEKEFFEEVHIILVGDHGMVGTCDKKMICLDDLARWITIPPSWVEFYYPVLAIRPNGSSKPKPSDVVAKMNEGLQSGEVESGKNLTMYLKEDLPDRLHYAESDRIAPIIGMLEEGFKVNQTRTGQQECGGAHGYDNNLFSMRTIFIGRGPRFPKGKKVPSFKNIEIYNLITSILNIQGAPNNGSESFPATVLSPSMQ